MKFSVHLIAFLLLLVSCSGGAGSKESFGSLDVYYLDGVSKDDAIAVGDYLFGIGFGVSDEPEKIQLSKDGDRYLCKFVVEENELGLSSIFSRYGKSISQKALNGAPVDIDLCDADFNSLKFLGGD